MGNALIAGQYARLHSEQSGCCAICGAAEDGGGRRHAVDHCHSTGRIRGLLCAPCNRGLGQFADDPERMRAAAAYVEEHASRTGPLVACRCGRWTRAPHRCRCRGSVKGAVS